MNKEVNAPPASESNELTSPTDPAVHTFSIIAFDPERGDLGVAVASRYLASGSVVPWAKAGVGAIATQAIARFSFGPEGLKLLEQGIGAQETLRTLIQADPKAATRQLAVIDANGVTASHTGAECMEWAGDSHGANFAVQGNILEGPGVISAMAAAFEDSRRRSHAELADCLMAALQAGQETGGDRRGKQSAAMLVVRANGGPGGDNDRYIDLRVDDHAEPVTELGRLLGLHNQFHPHLHTPKNK